MKSVFAERRTIYIENGVIRVYNRYYFTKKIFSEYLVLLSKGKKYYSFGYDRKILEYIGFNDKLSKIRKKGINYLVLDNLDIIEKEEFLDNNITKYKYLVGINEILDEIKVIISKDML